MSLPRSALLRFVLPRLLLALLAFRASPVGAQDSSSPDAAETAVTSSHKPPAELMSDLTSSDPSTRLYAARSLRGQLRSALHTEAHGRPGTLLHDDAISRLVELDARLPDACMAALAYENVIAPCADMLAMLGTATAREPLTEASPKAKGRAAQRTVQEAIACLDGKGCCPQESARECLARLPAP